MLLFWVSVLFPASQQAKWLEKLKFMHFNFTVVHGLSPVSRDGFSISKNAYVSICLGFSDLYVPSASLNLPISPSPF